MKFSPMGEARFKLWFESCDLKSAGLSCAPLKDSALSFFTQEGTENPFTMLRRDGKPVRPFYVTAADFMPERPAEHQAIDAMLFYGDTNGIGHLARFWLASGAERRARIQAAFADEFKHYAAMAASGDKDHD